MGELLLKNLTIRYGSAAVVHEFDLAVHDAEMVSLLGPSGAGKTTVLKAVMVFQKSLLFPFMNVAQNIGFGLRMRGHPGAEINRQIDRILELTELTGLGQRKVHELSGGQQQRVSLARALVLKPAVLLLDEPLSNLDANLRQQMRELIQDIQAETRITTIFVTHDQAEALMISHRVGLLLDGRLRQVGNPRELFYRPADTDVARFFGGCNFIHGKVRDGIFRSEFGNAPAPAINGNGHWLTATIRPEDILIAAEPKYDLQGQIQKINFEGSATRIWVQCRDTRFVILTSEADFAPGQKVGLHLPPEKIRVFPAEAKSV
jgi:ABC-type sugar transport system ATPase subunit